MQIWEGVTLAMNQLRSEKLKTFFSLLGVIMGVMFLIVVVTVIEGLDQYVREEVTAQVFGINTVTVGRWDNSDVNADEEVWRRRLRHPRLRYEDAEAIREQLTIPAIIAVESSTSSDAIGDNGRTATGVRVTGASPELFTVRNLGIARGRAFSQQEADRGIPVVVLGKETAEVIFEDLDPIGRTVRLRGFRYRVIGVLEERGSIFGQSQDNFAVAPARSPIQSVTNPRGVISSVIIQASDPDQVRDIQQEVEGIMRSRRQLRPREANNFGAETAEDAISFWDNISR
ncbi:MAG: ABC transporter permease, partial [Candidatus Poribacteria bacterium]